MKKLLVVMFLAFLACGCATSRTNIRCDYNPSSTPDESLVIGKVKFRNIDNLYKRIQIYLKNATDGKDYMIYADEATLWQAFMHNGKDESMYFFVSLPKGRYAITGMKMADWRINMSAAMDVPAAGNIYYVGTIDIFRPKINKFLGLPVGRDTLEINVIDEREEAVALFRDKYPHINEEIISNPVEVVGLSKKKLKADSNNHVVPALPQ